ACIADSRAAVDDRPRPNGARGAARIGYSAGAHVPRAAAYCRRLNRQRSYSMTERKRKPEVLGQVVASWLGTRGLAERVEQATVIPEWSGLVGPQIAAVTTPQSITSNGTLYVQVTTNSWMNELSLLEPELLRSLNAKAGRKAIRKIRWVIGKMEERRSG